MKPVPPVQYKKEGHPVMTFDAATVDLGIMAKGQKKTHVYNFKNTGDSDLIIEIVSGCDCTTITWPEGKVFKPGEGDVITAVFDSSKESVGPTEKTIDIVANTDPIIVELKYTATIVEE